MNRENCIEWLTGQDVITISLTQKKYITKVKRIVKQHENLADIIENADGSIVAHLPLSSLKLNIKTGRERTEEEKAAGAEALRKWRESQK